VNTELDLQVDENRLCPSVLSAPTSGLALPTQALSRTHFIRSGTDIAAKSSAAHSLPAAPEPAVLIVLVVCVRQAEYVSSKYSSESGSAVAACKLF
jgi:hypothetical protein